MSREFSRLPMVGLALAFMAGTAAGLAFPSTDNPLCVATPLAVAAAGALFIAAGWRRAPSPEPGYSPGSSLTSAGILILLVGVAWFNAAVRIQTGPPALTDQSTLSGKRVELLGIITDEPIPVNAASGSCWQVTLEAEQVRPKGATDWQPIQGAARVRWYQAPPEVTPAYGERWLIQGSMDITNFGTRPQPFVFVRAFGRGCSMVDARAGSSVVRWSLGLRAFARQVLNRGIEHHPRDVAVLNSLLLGVRSQMPNDIYRSFARTGTLHIFAISGSHIVVLAAVIVFLVSSLGLSRPYWALAVGPVLVIYTVMTGLQSSAIRACIMGVIFLAAYLVGRRPDTFSALAASAILILAVVPTELVSLGFILSYVAMLGLLLLYPVIDRPFANLFQPDPLRIDPESNGVIALRTAWKEIRMLLTTSLAAWLVCEPLTAYYFQIFSPIALIGNLIAIPLSGLMIVTGCLSLMTGSCIPWFGTIFNHANLLMAQALTGSMAWLTAVPYGNMDVEPPPAWAVAGCYVLLAIPVILAKRAAMKSEEDDRKALPPETAVE